MDLGGVTNLDRCRFLGCCDTRILRITRPFKKVMEIERKWLVDKEVILPLLKSGVRIEQHYLNDINEKWLIRARRYGSMCVLTLKGRGMLTRPELEYNITENEYLDTIKYSEKSLKKTRFFLPVQFGEEMYYEIDIYDDYDFITCEVEFISEEEAEYFVPPEWCVKELTNDPDYQNVNLAQ